MGDNSKIAWTDATWSPIVGCTKVSEGCRNCYAFSLHEKRHKAFQEGKLQNIPQYAQPFNKIQLLEDRLQQPLKWKRPRKIFVNSLSDLFHPDVPFEFIDKVFAVMGRSQHHIFQILTKRPERMLEYFQSDRYQRILFESYKLNIKVRPEMMGAGIDDPKGWGNGKPAWGFSHVWLGVTAENQEQADKRIPILRQVPAAIRFLSIEPMLGPIDLLKFHYHEGDSLEMRLPFDLVICGGESGPNARPLHPDNVRSLRDQCVAAGVKFFFKQWGEWTSVYPQGRNLAHVEEIYRHGMTFYRTGTKHNGSLLDGREWKELPEVAQ